MTAIREDADGVRQYGWTLVVPRTQWEDDTIQRFLHGQLIEGLTKHARDEGYELFGDAEITVTPVRSIVSVDTETGRAYSTYKKCSTTNCTDYNIAAYSYAF